MLEKATEHLTSKQINYFKKNGQFPRITDNYYRFRQIEPKEFQEGTLRIKKDKIGNALIVGKLLDGDYSIQSVLIGKNNIYEKDMNEYLQDIISV